MQTLRFVGCLTAALATVAFVAVGFGSAPPAHACSPSLTPFVHWHEAFESSTLVVKGKAVNRRLVLEETRVAPKPKVMTEGARSIMPPWNPETTATGDVEELWFLYVDIEVDDVLSGKADDLVTLVIGPARDEADLEMITLPIGLSDTIFMLDNTGQTDTVGPSKPFKIQYHNTNKDLFRVIKYIYFDCPSVITQTAIFHPHDNESRAIIEYAAKR